MRGDVVCGALGLTVAAVYYRAADGLPTSLLADAVGADGVPKALAASLGVLSLLLLGRALAARPTAPIGPPADAAAPSHHGRALGIVGLAAAYVAIAPYLGYPLALTLLIAATTVYFGIGLGPRVILVAAAGAAVLWAMFEKMLGIAMPAGAWPRLLG